MRVIFLVDLMSEVSVKKISARNPLVLQVKIAENTNFYFFEIQNSLSCATQLTNLKNILGG